MVSYKQAKIFYARRLAVLRDVISISYLTLFNKQGSEKYQWKREGWGCNFELEISPHEALLLLLRWFVLAVLIVQSINLEGHITRCTSTSTQTDSVTTVYIYLFIFIFFVHHLHCEIHQY